MSVMWQGFQNAVLDTKDVGGRGDKKLAAVVARHKRLLAKLG